MRYMISPWFALPALVTAIVMAILYQPPLVGCIVTIAGSFIGGMAVAYGPLFGHRWMESWGLALVWLTPFFANQLYDLHPQDGRFWSLLAWMMFGISAPSCIWRKRGLEAFRPVVPAGTAENSSQL